MKNERRFTAEEHNEALDFAYAMGLRRPFTAETEDEGVLGFANAMGLRHFLNKDTFSVRKSRKGLVPQPTFA